MNHGRIVFSQIMDYFPRRRFKSCVDRYRGDHRVKTFTCLDQFYCMTFAQLTGRESLRDIEACLRAAGPKLYHAGLKARVSRTTLAKANEGRDWRIYRDLALILIDQARTLYAASTAGNESQASGLRTGFHRCRFVPDTVSMGSASSAQKCRQSPHATRSARQHSGVYPHYRRSDARCAFSRPCDIRGWSLLYHGQRVHRFSTSVPHSSTAIVLRYAGQKQHGLIPVGHPIRWTKAEGLRSDQSIRLTGPKSSMYYPELLRRIHYVDIERDKRFLFLTNNFKLSPWTIARLYKFRWQIELFFKWIKQHLRIKAFYGTTPNAVKTQVWIAISVYVLVAILKKELDLQASMYEILQVLGLMLFEKTPVKRLFSADFNNVSKNDISNQLCLFDL